MTVQAFLGFSHTPLMGLNPISVQEEQKLQNAIAAVREQVLAFAPELIVLVAPDHYNGFFNELMPPFCVGVQASSVGDYLSPAGDLNVDSVAAQGMATRLMDADFDIAISHRMRVDHGFAQPLQLIWGGLNTPPVIPLFLNAAAPPVIPRLRRCHAIGQAIGRILQDEPRRTLVIGSGGLSHEPPVPTLSNPDPAVVERITFRQHPTAAEREAKTQRVMAAGMALASGNSAYKPLNPEWDRQWMDALAGDTKRVQALCAMSEESIALEGGHSAHESKTWLVGRGALQGSRAPRCVLRHYQAIPEYIAGFGIMLLTQTD